MSSSARRAWDRIVAARNRDDQARHGRYDGAAGQRFPSRAAHSRPTAGREASMRTKLVRVGLVLALSFVACVAATRLASAACTNDVDCPTATCGGQVCQWGGVHMCVPAGTDPQGSDGWCTTDTDCKCMGEGARCVSTNCTFTVPRRRRRDPWLGGRVPRGARGLGSHGGRRRDRVRGREHLPGHRLERSADRSRCRSHGVDGLRWLRHRRAARQGPARPRGSSRLRALRP